VTNLPLFPGTPQVPVLVGRAAGYFAFAPCKMISVSVSITRLAGRNRPVTYWHASVLTPG